MSVKRHSQKVIGPASKRLTITKDYNPSAYGECAGKRAAEFVRSLLEAILNSAMLCARMTRS